MRLAQNPITRFVLAAVLVVGPVAGTALARGSKAHVASTSTLEMVPVDPTDADVNWGDQVTFNVSTNATNYPVVTLQCYRGELVYSASAGFYPEYPWQYAQTFTLRSNAWTGGAAACTATLQYNDGKRIIELKSLDFAVAA
jgi:hypothetical protein